MMQRRSLKARILDHAELRLLEQGFRGMRVDELARDVGISKRTLYELFRTKEDMAREALERVLADMLVDIDRAMHDHREDPSEQLQASIRVLAGRFANAQEPFYRDLDTTPSLVTQLEEARAQAFVKIDAIIQAGVASGHFRSDVESHCVCLVLTAVLELFQRRGAGRQGLPTLDVACTSLHELLTRGLLATRSADA